MKRYIYIIISIVVAAVVVVAIFFLIKNNGTASSQGSLGSTTPGGSLPAVGTQGSNGSGTASTVGTLGLAPATGSSTPSAGGQVTVQNFGVLSSEPVLDYFVDAHNNITAIEPTGEIIAISNGQTTTINASTTGAIISASFSYDGKKIVVSYGNPSSPDTEIFDASTSAWTQLSRTVFSPQWSPANNYLLAYLTVPSNGTLSLATMNAANPKAAPTTLLTLNANDLTLQWATANEFILSDKPTDEAAGSIWAFNSTAGTLTPLIYEIPGVEAIWSHDAAIPYGLAFFDNQPGAGQNTTLQLQAFSGNLPTETLSLSTLPSKCAFDPEMMPAAATSTSTSSVATSTTAASSTASSTPYLALYCGIPRSSSGFSSAHLPDDYNTLALFTSDDIYKINTATGAVQILWSDATQNMDVSDVKFFNNALFFVNRYDQKLYGLTFSN